MVNLLELSVIAESVVNHACHRFNPTDKAFSKSDCQHFKNFILAWFCELNCAPTKKNWYIQILPPIP